VRPVFPSFVKIENPRLYLKRSFVQGLENQLHLFRSQWSEALSLHVEVTVFNTVSFGLLDEFEAFWEDLFNFD
jgi:hypothetical protein